MFDHDFPPDDPPPISLTFDSEGARADEAEFLARLEDPAYIAMVEETLFSESAAGVMLTPQERFEQEYELRDVPRLGMIPADSTEGAARLMQDVAVQAQRALVRAEVQRVETLLDAFEVSLEDLEARFGPTLAARDGLGAKLFHRRIAVATNGNPLRISNEVDVATTLRDRLPATWAVFLSGEASWSRAQTVVREVHGLDAEHWLAYDEQAAGLVVDSPRLKHDLVHARERLQDDTAAARARTTFDRRGASLEHGHDGAATFVIEGTAPKWVAFDQALQRAAVAAHGDEGETRTIQQLRHDIVEDLLCEGIKQQADPDWTGLRVPARRGVEVKLFLTVPVLSLVGRTKEPAQLSGFGPIDLETAKDLAGSATSFVRVMTEPMTGVRLSMDRTVYSPPADLARWVRIRDGRSRFPTSTKSSWLCDIDHAREWQHDGRTEAVNLVSLDRMIHNMKSAGLLQEVFCADGSVAWRDIWGNEYVDPPFEPHDPVPADLLPTPVEEEPCPF